MTTFRDAMFSYKETENGALSNSTTQNPLIDLFFHSIRGMSKDRLFELLSKSFNSEPLLTLKLIANLRNIRGGKGERNLGIEALEWLYLNSPDNLFLNIEAYISYGRWLDLVQLYNLHPDRKLLSPVISQLRKDMGQRETPQDSVSFLTRFMNSMRGTTEQQIETTPTGVSLLAKWIPSEGKKHFHPFSIHLMEEMKIDRKQFRNMITGLRTKINILERQLTEKRVGDVNYSHVPSVAMKIHGRPKNVFNRVDKERFVEWKASLARGETKVNTSALYPHDIVQEYTCGYYRYSHPKALDTLLEEQWKTMMNRLSDSTKQNLSRCLVMSDLSGSMEGLPMSVSIALGILISSMIPESSCFNNFVLSFSAEPTFVDLSNHRTLRDKIAGIHKNAGVNTDFYKAFMTILNRAKACNLPKEEMPKTLIVLSDMQFDNHQNGSKRYTTNYQQLKNEFTNSGYDIPSVIFWNLRGNIRDFPATNSDTNVSMISGFSVELLNDILDGEIPSPYSSVVKILNNPIYDKIKLA
jgi:hypothetical protein